MSELVKPALVPCKPLKAAQQQDVLSLLTLVAALSRAQWGQTQAVSHHGAGNCAWSKAPKGNVSVFSGGHSPRIHPSPAAKSVIKKKKKERETILYV